MHYIFDCLIDKHNTVVTENPPDIEFATNQGAVLLRPRLRINTVHLRP